MFSSRRSVFSDASFHFDRDRQSDCFSLSTVAEQPTIPPAAVIRSVKIHEVDEKPRIIDMGSPTESNPQPPSSPPSPAAPKAAMRHLFVAWSRGELTLLILATALSGIVAGAKTVYTLILGSIFQVLSEYGSGTRAGSSMVHSVSTWCLGLVGLGLGKAVFSSLLMALWITHGEARVRRVRQQLFRSFLCKDMGWFDTRGGGVSGLMTEQYTQLRDLQTATSQLMGLIVSDAIVGVACIIVALVKSWQLTLMLLATVPVAVIALNVLGRHMKSAAELQRLELNQAAKHATAALEAIDLVKVYHGHDAALWQYGRSMRAAAASYVRQAFGSSSQMGVIKLWMIDLFVIGFWFGIWLVTSGLASAGNILTAFYAVLTAFQSVEALGTQWVAILRGTVAGRALEDMIGDPVELARPKPSLKLPTPPSHVRLVNVSFAYPSNPSKLVLRDCTMSFPPGQVSFVVGRSGSGKSTIADLLVRFYRPTTGHVLIDNVPVEALNVQWLRENLALIQQASTVFDGTLGWNIALGSGAPETVSTADIRLACQTALLQSTVAGLPQGLDTPVGPRGGAVALSGGQRQRLAIARAKIRDPAVLVLDETTSGLDPKSAQMVLEAVRAWRGQGHRTTIIITHDIAQIAADDHVFVMDRGRLVQEGSFSRLNRSAGLLGTLVQAVSTDGNEAAATACLSPIDKIGLDEGEGTLTHQKSVCLSPVERWRMARAEHQDSSFFQRGSFLAAPFASGSYTQRPQSVVGQRPMTIPEVSYVMTEVDDNESIQQSIDLLRDQGIRAQRSRHGRKVRDSAVSDRPLLQKNQTSSADHHVPSVALLHVLRTVWPLLNRASRLDAVVGLACCVLVAACNPVFSYVFARMLSSFWSPEEDKEAVGRPWALVLLGLSVIDGSAVFGTFYLAERVGQVWINTLRTEAMTRLLRQPKSWWSGGQESESSSESSSSESSTSPLRIVECLDRGGEEMRKLVSIFVPILTMAAVMVVISVIWSLAVSWRLTLVSLASGPVIIGATHLASRISDTWEDRANRAAETVSAVFTETFPHIRVVRALTLESCFATRLTAAARAAFVTGLSRAWRTGVLYGINQALSDWLTALVFFYGAQLLTAAITSSEYLSVNEVMRVVNLLLFSIGSAAALLGNVPQIAAAKTVAAQILAYSCLSLHASSHEHPPVPLARPRQLLPVQMDNLVFRYPGSSPSSTTTTDAAPNRPAILHGISLTIEANEFVGLVGSSGSGKSTILSLLLRLYDTDSLSFNGTRAYELDTQAVRAHVAYVPQHPYLFPTTVRDNITYGLDEDSPLRQDACIADAARAANIHAFIVSLAHGYDTQVGDVASTHPTSTEPSSSSSAAKSDGVSAFSGGQAQRICIARAMLRRPELLVLDEPTSALDAESAHTIRNTLRQFANYRNGSSIVVATHSKAMMQQCDRLIVVQDGAIVANGSYSYLLQHSNVFSQLMGEYDD